MKLTEDDRAYALSPKSLVLVGAEGFEPPTFAL